MNDPSSLYIRAREVSGADLAGAARSKHLYAIVDACRVPGIPKKVLQLGDSHAVSLYRGGAEESYWDVAPYLVRADPKILTWLKENASKPGWGIFVASRADLDQLRAHFRHFLKVLEPARGIWLFRFYDPRVLKPFLPSCTEEELKVFFGPVDAYGVADPEFESATFFQQAKLGSNQSRPTPRPDYSFMFRLRNPHLEALKPQAEAAFAAEVIEFLKAVSPTAVSQLSAEILEKRVLLGLSRATKYGFKRNSSLAAFVAIMFDVSPNFDQQPRIHAVLNDEKLPPDLRIDVLMGRTTGKDWEEAMLSYSPDSWSSNSNEGTSH